MVQGTLGQLTHSKTKPNEAKLL